MDMHIRQWQRKPQAQQAKSAGEERLLLGMTEGTPSKAHREDPLGSRGGSVEAEAGSLLEGWGFSRSLRVSSSLNLGLVSLNKDRDPDRTGP